jgi:Tfp pilus assembly protein PilX
LANIILSVVSSQSRLTHHQISRIQAFYAAQAGVNYAREMIRLNNSTWVPENVGATVTEVKGRICRDTTDCGSGFTGPKVSEASLPTTVRWVEVTIGKIGSGVSGTREIKATVDYAPPS